MSSKRLSMDDIKRMTRSQTKAKSQNKQLPNLTTTEPSVSGYNGVLPTSIDVPPFDETANSGPNERNVKNKGEEGKKTVMEGYSFKVSTPTYDEARK